MYDDNRARDWAVSQARFAASSEPWISQGKKDVLYVLWLIFLWSAIIIGIASIIFDF